MPLLWVAVAIALMLVLLLRVRLDAFFALLLTSLAVGLLNGMDVLAALRSILRGVGSTMGSVALILVFGAMLGRLVDESGAAHAITTRLTDRFGRRHVQYAMALTGLLVGLPMLYNAGFLLLIPLVYAVAATTGLPPVYVGVPLAAALSVTHGFLPPHPAPTFVAFAYGADVNKTLLVGLVATVPAVLAGGVLFGRLLPARGAAAPPAGLFAARAVDRAALPGLGVSLLSVLLPVLLMLVGAVVDVALGTAALDPLRADGDFDARLAAAVADPGARRVVVAAKFVGNATVALLLAVLVSLYTLGVRRGRTMDDLMRSLAGAGGGDRDDPPRHRGRRRLLAGAARRRRRRVRGGARVGARARPAGAGVRRRRAAAARGRIGDGGRNDDGRRDGADRARRRRAPRADGARHRRREPDVLALQRHRLLDVQGVLRPHGAADVRHLERDGDDRRAGGAGRRAGDARARLSGGISRRPPRPRRPRSRRPGAWRPR
jgi:gluconate transporter